MAVRQVMRHSLVIHYKSAAEIYEVGPRFHEPELFFSKHIAVPGFSVDVQRNDVSLLENFLKCTALCIAARQHIIDVAENHAHAGRLSEIRELRADPPVPHDAKCQAAHLMAASRTLVPSAGMHGHARCEYAANQHDDFSQSQLRHRPAIAVGI